MGTSAVITLVGRLGADPERSKDGKSVRFSVCVDGRSGPVWYSVAAWGQTATACESFLKKGGLAQIVGGLDAGAYVNAKGEVAPRLFVNAFNITFLNSGQEKNVFFAEKNSSPEKEAPAEQAYVPTVSFATAAKPAEKPVIEAPAAEEKPPVEKKKPASQAEIPKPFLDIDLWTEVTP